MNNNVIRDAPMHALKNRKVLQETTMCACYQCYNFFGTCEIEEWTDATKDFPEGATAICPKCGTDCVLPDEILGDTTMCAVGEVSPVLKAIHEYWLPDVVIRKEHKDWNSETIKE